MNMANDKKKFTESTRLRPCVVCGNITGHCKTQDGDRGDTLHYCHNHPSKPQGPIAEYYWTAAGGAWGIFSSEKPKYQGESTRSKAPNREVKLANPSDRDAAFRAYMSKLTLHPDDRDDIHRRGVSDTEIEAWGVVSIAGKEPGYLCPCYNPEGAIVGAQWRLRNIEEVGEDGEVIKKPRYKWVSWIGGGSKNGDEIPLAVHRPIGVTPSGIAVCEGTGAKSFILAQRSGMVAIGAGSDSQFVSSPEHWKAYLARLSGELNVKTLTFYPDAGSVSNDSVMGKYRQWFAAVAELGYEIQVAWWGQMAKGESPDPDELAAADDVRLISVEEFEAMGNPENTIGEIPWKCLSSHLNQLGAWKTQELGKNGAEMVKAESLFEDMKSNPNIKYNGERMAQANGEQAAHPLYSFSVFDPMMNVDFTVTKMIESPDGGMIEFKVIQSQGARIKTIAALIKSTDTTKVDKFVDAMKKAIGRNIVCNLKPQHLQALLQNRTAKYQIAGGKTFKLAPRTGRQDDGYFVFEHIQFNPQGEVCTEDESGWLFNRDLGIDEQVVSPQIAKQDKSAIGSLINAAAAYYSPETFPLALMVLGYGAASVHRDQIMEVNGSFPQINTFGDPGGGKTLAATMACALFATDRAPITQFSESVIYETVKSIGSLLLLVDDPLKKERRGGVVGDKVDNFVWAMYGGSARKVRGNEQKPKTNVIITSNKAIGEGSQAIESRMIKISFPVKKFNDSAKHDLSDAIRYASGGLSQLIGMKFDNEAIRESTRNLTPHLSGAHARLTTNYAILVHYTQRLCDLAGYKFDAMAYCIKHLCPAANVFDSDKDSLTDFLEKLATMKAEGKIGEWNMTQITKAYKPYLAIQLHSVWPIFEKEYQVNYSRQSIEALILERGGSTNVPQRFVKSKDVWVDYQKALNQFAMGTGKLGPDDVQIEPTKPKKLGQSRCVLIPSPIVDAAIGGENATDTNYSDNNSPSWEPPVVEVEQAPIAHNEIKAGEIATIAVDHPEADLESGDDVIVESVQQDEKSGVWFAVVRSDNEKDPISVWLSELTIHRSDPIDL